MYWENYMISYHGKNSSCFITKLKYEWDSVSREQLVDDLTRMRVVSNIELEPGYFDDYEKYLSWDKKFYNIPDYICKQAIDDWNKEQELSLEDKEELEKYYSNPIPIESFKELEYQVDKLYIERIISLQSKSKQESPRL